MLKLNCPICGKSFERHSAEFRRNSGGFCSRKCSCENVSRNVRANFWKKTKVVRRGRWQCWEWTGARNQDGYGWATYLNRCRGAHIFAYVFHHGVELKKGDFVCHACDNPCCVNPDHLFLGNHQSNMDDMAKKGRRFRKVTDEMIQEIREGRHTTAALAVKFSVSERTIRNYLPRTRKRIVNDHKTIKNNSSRGR